MPGRTEALPTASSPRRRARASEARSPLLRARGRAAECDASEVAYVGDRVDNDVLPAAAAGLAAIAIRRGGILQATPPRRWSASTTRLTHGRASLRSRRVTSDRSRCRRPRSRRAPLVLGGIAIDHPRGLAGHSDGDAIAHALNALLGAAGRDIGALFPSDDQRYRERTRWARRGVPAGGGRRLRWSTRTAQ
jgi:hypothetical protein